MYKQGKKISSTTLIMCNDTMFNITYFQYPKGFGDKIYVATYRIFYSFTSGIDPLECLGEQEENIYCTEITNKQREASNLKDIQVGILRRKTRRKCGQLWSHICKH